jgi:tripartite-type tricarboxylate transporter receptor subunit TctC
MTRYLGLILSMALLAATGVRAQDYPTGPVHIILPFAPGGVVDLAARLVGGGVQVEPVGVRTAARRGR